MIVNILYEDNHVVAVNKSPGIPLQGDESRDRSLFDTVKSYLKETYRKPGNVFLGIVHRLDRPVGGIVLFAKTSKGASRLSEQFRERRVKKIYDALVVGRPQCDSGVLVHYILKDQAINKVRIFDRPTDGALRAELSYRVEKSSKRYSLLKIELMTGRPHQIRAQLAALGCPIVGDVKYGGEPWVNPAGIALQAGFLAFETATTRERKELSLPVPSFWLELLTR